MQPTLFLGTKRTSGIPRDATLLSSGRRTRTPNSWTRTSCVTYYTIPEGQGNVTAWGAECRPKFCNPAESADTSEPVVHSAVAEDAAKRHRRCLSYELSDR
jgi:hypothetical protein